MPRDPKYDSESDISHSSYDGEDSSSVSAQDFTQSFKRLERKHTFKEHKQFLKQVKAFNLDSERLAANDAVRILGGEWNSNTVADHFRSELPEKELASELLKKHSLVINENVDMRLFFLRLEVFCKDKRNVSIQAKIKDADLALVLTKLAAHSPHLRSLSIKSCEVGKASAGQLAKLLRLHHARSLQSLKVLELSQCKVHSMQLTQIIKSLLDFRSGEK